MTEIKLNQELELNNLLSFRGKIKQSEMDRIGKDMDIKVKEAGAKRIGNPITATFGVEGEYIDVEVLIPLDMKIQNVGEYCFKDKLKITNAVVASYKGNPAGLQRACNELNQYIVDNKLQPITVGYNVMKRISPIDMESTEIDLYVGINPNIL